MSVSNDALFQHGEAIELSDVFALKMLRGDGQDRQQGPFRKSEPFYPIAVACNAVVVLSTISVIIMRRESYNMWARNIRSSKFKNCGAH